MVFKAGTVASIPERAPTMTLVATRTQLPAAWPLVAVAIVAVLVVVALVVALLVLGDPPMDPVPVPSVTQAYP